MAQPKPLEPLKTVSVKTPASLRDAFVLACQYADTKGSLVLRKAMRDFIAANPLPVGAQLSKEGDY